MLYFEKIQALLILIKALLEGKLIKKTWQGVI